uniref:Uncharacterized protein n=1 Tax=Trichinella nativa TaxID=6335 RepID=A0A0V1KJP4_9BILA
MSTLDMKKTRPIQPMDMIAIPGTGSTEPFVVKVTGGA